jgi:hypothetical protein
MSDTTTDTNPAETPTNQGGNTPNPETPTDNLEEDMAEPPVNQGGGTVNS